MKYDEEYMRNVINKSDNPEFARTIIRGVGLIIDRFMKEYAKILKAYVLSISETRKINIVSDSKEDELVSTINNEILINVLGNTMKNLNISKEEVIKMLDNIEIQHKNIIKQDEELEK